jgi:nucleoside-diphosphate-sugar epimerase
VRVMVTGASGFVGRVACAELRERGHEVLALVRRLGSEPAGTTAIEGDLTDEHALHQAVAGAEPEAILHLAAEIATQRDAARVEAVNVEGTWRLIEAAQAAGGPKIVFASTVVTGDAHGEVLDENSSLPVETAYGRSKQAGERLLRDCGLPFVIVRPSHVYGPGGWYASEIVGRLHQPGRLAIVGHGENWWDVVRVEDVATACADALERGAPGAIYHVVDDQPLRYQEFVGLTAKALEIGRPRHIPPWLARLAAGADPVRAVMRSAKSSNARIKSELGWKPRFPSAEQGVPDAVAQLLATR